MIQFPPDFAFTNDTPYVARVFHEIFKEMFSRYIESALYTSRKTIWSGHNLAHAMAAEII